MSPVISSVDACTLSLEYSALPAELAVTEGASTGAVRIPAFDGIDVGVWEHSTGVSTDTEASEVFVVISGRGRVTCEQGGVIDLAPGVVGILQEGARTRWEITEPLRKVWISRSQDVAR
ncbi:MAG: DUF861 domain-containing protein [Actinobacteria bacterium]|uniref:Unannotated protein n=1 Tax=freshwater metagenome TaxID=449393 RepID=A0A6J7JY06_9ZZZZ|nr:DUF861 domain-containing protein [Actinomycetota bacterium]